MSAADTAPPEPASLPPDAGPSFGVVGSGQQPARMPEASFFRDVAAAAEELGYDSLWSTDHISFINPILEGLVALAFFAGATRRITLGTGIYLLPLRHPSAVAKQVASLDHLAEGRLVFGVGVGGESADDFRAVGVPVKQRGARTDEAIDVLRALLGGADLAHHGRFYDVDDVTIAPPPVQQPSPPIWVGGRSDAALARVGRRGDGWLAYLVSPQRLRDGMEAVADHAADVGRDAQAITSAVMLPVHVADDRSRARREAQEHLSARYRRPFDPELLDRCCAVGTPADCVARIDDYLRAGARHVVLNPAGTPEMVVEEMRVLATEVLPALRTASRETGP